MNFMEKLSVVCVNLGKSHTSYAHFYEQEGAVFQVPNLQECRISFFSYLASCSVDHSLILGCLKCW
jgi:hypothetical protein